MSLGTRGLCHYRWGGGIQVFLIAGGHCWSHITPKIPGNRALPGKSDHSSRGSRLIPLFSELFLTAHPSPSSSWPSFGSASTLHHIPETTKHTSWDPTLLFAFNMVKNIILMQKLGKSLEVNTDPSAPSKAFEVKCICIQGFSEFRGKIR